jgi:hypothetical protein
VKSRWEERRVRLGPGGGGGGEGTECWCFNRANILRGYSRYVVDWWEITRPRTRRLKRGHETQIFTGSGRQDSVIPYVLFKGVYMALCLGVLVSGIGTDLSLYSPGVGY